MSIRVKLKSKDAAALEEFVERVRAALGNNLVEVKLFESDIDVLVAVEEGGIEIEDQMLDIAFDTNLKHEVYISPRVIDRATLADPVWRITPFLKAIAKEGIPL